MNVDTSGYTSPPMMEPYGHIKPMEHIDPAIELRRENAALRAERDAQNVELERLRQREKLYMGPQCHGFMEQGGLVHACEVYKRELDALAGDLEMQRDITTQFAARIQALEAERDRAVAALRRIIDADNEVQSADYYSAVFDEAIQQSVDAMDAARAVLQEQDK